MQARGILKHEGPSIGAPWASLVIWDTLRQLSSLAQASGREADLWMSTDLLMCVSCHKGLWWLAPRAGEL